MQTLQPLIISGAEVLPIVEGGKGVSVSNGRSAGAFAAAGCVGTFSAVNADNFDEDGRVIPQIYRGKTRRDRYEELVGYAIQGGITQAKKAYDVSAGRGRLHMNVLWEAAATQRILHGVLEGAKGLIHGVTCGAGMPYKMAEICAQYGTYYYPIVSSARAFRALWKRAYHKYRDYLGGVVYEDPWLAGGHNGIEQLRGSHTSRASLFPGCGTAKGNARAGGWNDADFYGWWRVVPKRVGRLDRQSGSWANCLSVRDQTGRHHGKPGLARMEEEATDVKGRGCLSQSLQSHRILFIGCPQCLHPGIERAQQSSSGLHPRAGGRGIRKPCHLVRGGRVVYLTPRDKARADAWIGGGYGETMKTPDSTLIFVTPEKSVEIRSDQQACMGCLSACRFSNWAENDAGNTGKPADPRSFCIQKTLQSIAHDGNVDNNLLFAGHNAYRFASDPFYENGFIPKVEQLVDRILTGD